MRSPAFFVKLGDYESYNIFIIRHVMTLEGQIYCIQ